LLEEYEAAELAKEILAEGQRTLFFQDTRVGVAKTLHGTVGRGSVDGIAV
jgi:hypothetical protein